MNQPRQLPTVRLRGKVWTIDERLRELRHVGPPIEIDGEESGREIEFLAFDDLSREEYVALVDAIDMDAERA